MNRFRPILAFCALLLTAAGAAAQLRQEAWVSYRDAYRAMVVFEKYGQPKNLIQQHLQVMPKEPGVSLDGVQLAVRGKTTELSLPLDGAGRAVFPLLKAAYDENASLVLNRKADDYRFRRRVSIAARPDGVYDMAELRAACAQVLAFAQYAEPGAGAHRCVGVRFAFGKGQGEPGLRLRGADGSLRPLPAVDGAAFADDPNAQYKVVNVMLGATGQVLTQAVPVAIATVID